MTGYADYRPDRRFAPTVAISPDGARVAYSDNASGQFNLVVQDASEGGAAVRLTDYTESTVRVFAWTPDGTALLFSADTHGDEFHQVRRVPAGGGEVVTVTDHPRVQHHLGEVSPDGRWVSYGANDRDPAHQDVLVRDLTTGETHRVYAGGGFVFAGPFSPDGKRMTAVVMRSNTDQVVYLCGVADGAEPTRIFPLDAAAPAKVEPGPWAADGSGFFLLTDAGRDFVGLARYDVPDGNLHWVETPEWDVEHVDLSADGRVLVWSVNAGGASELHARDLVTGADLPVPPLPPCQALAVSVDAAGRRVAVLVATGANPTNVAVLDIEGAGSGGGTVRWVTDTAPVGGDLPRVEPTAVSYPTADGRQIPAWLYRPAGDGPFPVLLSIHGGPEAQERPSYSYSGLYQYLLSRGIAVFAPNVRGSSGYGRAYQSLIHRDWGGAELLDFAAAADHLRTLPWVDTARVGVFGASFGGFAVLSCLSRLPDRDWACGVDIVGPSNLVTLTRSCPPTWRAQMGVMIGDPETEADFLLSRSPVTYADAITAPLFVIQGANDPRVPQAESDQVVARLRERGVEVRYDVYPDEGHGFTKRENEARAMGDTAEFLVRHLVLERD
ncbi:S9 family peptidase [Rhizomonospora bruguierae]|uniref:S9 family peptidase n=1 Tax=Rhizomonospora bruguierae TaxID=1581705 RepID=UPI001BCEA67E|nr:S9 family peptidase [Micromonospora sp. NBRC 107566]